MRKILPPLWLGHSVDTPSPISQLESLNSSPSLFSFGDAIRRPQLKTKFIGRIGEAMGFRGPVMVDSGGFTISRSPNVSYDASDVGAVYEKIDADVFVSLDLPPSRDDCQETRAQKIKLSAENYKKMSRLKISGPLMPVIHGRNLTEIELSCNLTEQAGYAFGPIGIGGLVPLLQSSGGSSNARRFIVEAIREVRARFASEHLHVFGAGSPNTIRGLLAAGADSADSIAWRQAAAFGSIYLPGSAQRLLKWEKANRPSRPLINDDEREQLENCRCPACRIIDPEKKVANLASSFRARAIHNAFVIKNELNDSSDNRDVPPRWREAMAS